MRWVAARCWWALVRAGWFALFVAARVPRGGRRGSRMWRWAYRRYMRSEAWRRARRRAVSRAGGECARWGCSARGALDVHHRSYVLMGLDPWFVLVAICRPCHERTHGRRIPRGGRRVAAQG